MICVKLLDNTSFYFSDFALPHSAKRTVFINYLLSLSLFTVKILSKRSDSDGFKSA